MCTATQSDGTLARIETERLEKHIYRVKVYPSITGYLNLLIDFVD
jgi:hypothetical protein